MANSDVKSAATERRVAIVSGASSGIGASVARRLAELGCDVLIVYSRNDEGATATLKSISKLGNGGATLKADVSRDRDCRSIVDAAMSRWGRIDIVVNNAGITKFSDSSRLDDLDADDFMRLYAVNAVGGYQLSRAASRYLKLAPAGSIVNVSSDVAFTGSGSSIAYAASKAALNGITLGLARSLAPQVRVNAVCPSSTDTNWAAAWMGADEYDAFKKAVADRAPLKRIPKPEDIADTICWLAVGAPCITGQLITIDCGLHLVTGTDTL